MYAYICILLGKVRTLLKWADELLSKMWDAWTGWIGWSGVDSGYTLDCYDY